MINAMKKLILIITLMTAVSFSGNSQRFYASFGVQHNWGVPLYVSNVVYDNYYGYDWVHATRVVNNGRPFYDIVLQRGNLFLEVRIGRQGFIRRTRHWDAYPFVDHVCSDACGFHGGFYRNNYVVYNNRRYGYRYRGSNTLIINNHNVNNKRHHNHGKQYGHNRSGDNKHHIHNRQSNSKVNRRAVSNGYPERRGTYYSSNKTRGRVDHGKRSSYENGERGEQKDHRSSRGSSRRSY